MLQESGIAEEIVEASRKNAIEFDSIVLFKTVVETFAAFVNVTLIPLSPALIVFPVKLKEVFAEAPFTVMLIPRPPEDSRVLL